MSPVARTSWKTLPAPHKRERLDVREIFSDAAADRMRDGHLPVDMDDRWFIFFEDGWLNFHRSWTGAHIFALKLDGCPAGIRVLEGWASREPEQYRSQDIEHDRKVVVRLIHTHFGQ
jgi:hypothetical protein